MKRRFGAAGLCIAGAVALTYAPLSQALIANGSFEQPDVADGNAQAITPTSWSWVGSTGFVIDPAPGTLLPQAGEQYADIGNTSVFVLQQSVTIDVPGLYALTWYDSAAAFAQTAPYRVSLGPLQNVQFDANEAVDGRWHARTLRVALTAGVTTLSFSPVDVPGPIPAQDRHIDDVTLSAVPLPAACWPLAAALLALPRRRHPARAIASGPVAAPTA